MTKSTGDYWGTDSPKKLAMRQQVLNICGDIFTVALDTLRAIRGE
jgi:hypothetical protein